MSGWSVWVECVRSEMNGVIEEVSSYGLRIDEGRVLGKVWRPM